MLYRLFKAKLWSTRSYSCKTVTKYTHEVSLCYGSSVCLHIVNVPSKYKNGLDQAKDV